MVNNLLIYLIIGDLIMYDKLILLFKKEMHFELDGGLRNPKFFKYIFYVQIRKTL